MQEAQEALNSDKTATLLPANFRSATIPRQPNGSLGMVVREREDGGCYVDGFADDASELTARGSVVPGDHILAVCGNFIDGKGQRHLRELLKEAHDPVVLLLRREPEPAPPVPKYEESLTSDSDDEPKPVDRDTLDQLKATHGTPVRYARMPTGDRRFGLGPLNAVLERARSDVDNLFRAYESNIFTKWQLKMALTEKTPTLNGTKPRVLKQAKSGPEEKQRLLMLMLAHNLTPLEIYTHVLHKENHLCKDRLQWVAISQDKMRMLYEQNNNRRVYLYFEKHELAPLPAKFRDCGFARTRATMTIDKDDDDILSSHVQRVQFSFTSANHPDELPLTVEFDLFNTKPYLDLLGLDEHRLPVPDDETDDEEPPTKKLHLDEDFD